MSEQTALDKKLCAIMTEIESVPKDGWNDHFKYAYVTAQAVSDLVRGLLAKHGVRPKIQIIDVEDLPNNIVRVTLEITLKDSETGQKETYIWPATAQDRQDKGLYKAYTTGMKYFWLTQFVMSTGDVDADSDHGAKQATDRQPAQKKTPKKPAPPKEPLANGEQKTRIHELMDGLEIAKRSRDKTLRDAGFVKMSELTAKQATEVIARLETKLQEKVNGD